jgi:Ser/Thr protein kinase RdoA (MazF antagonist)
MRAEVVTGILEGYGLTPRLALPVQKGYRNESHPVVLSEGRTVNLILYKRELGIVNLIRRVNTLTSFLAGCGLPVRAPSDQRILRVQGAQVTRYAALYNYLPGVTIPWEAYTQKHLKLLGKTLSDLHAALSDYDYTKGMPKVTDVYLAIATRMARYFADGDVRKAMAGKLQLSISPSQLERVKQLMLRCRNLPNQQVLHMDFVRSNVLFASADNEFGLVISGILDFEKAAVGHPLFDIARTLAFLIVDCKYKPKDKVRKYFLYSGYAKRGAARLPQSAKLLEALITMFLLYDFYKFLQHNPYEYLEQNEHFVRTRDLLMQRGVITTTTRYG